MGNIPYSFCLVHGPVIAIAMQCVVPPLPMRGELELAALSIDLSAMLYYPNRKIDFVGAVTTREIRTGLSAHRTIFRGHLLASKPLLTVARGCLEMTSSNHDGPRIR